MIIWWLVAILFGYHGNIQFWKRNFLNDNSFKTTEAVGLYFGTNVPCYRTIQNSQKFCGLPLGLIAMATESSHRLIMEKWLNCTFSITSEVNWAIFGSYDHLMIVYSVCMFYDWWPFCLVATATFNFEKGLFQNTTSKPLKQYNNLVQMLLG